MSDELLIRLVVNKEKQVVCIKDGMIAWQQTWRRLQAANRSCGVSPDETCHTSTEGLTVLMGTKQWASYAIIINDYSCYKKNQVSITVM